MLRSERLERFLVLLIIGGAAFLRFVRLGGSSLWLDEILNVSLTRSAMKLPWYRWMIGFEPENGPLYYILQALTLQCCGSIETAFRIPAALVGTISVAGMYFLAKRIGGPVVAAVAAVLLALSPAHVYYSREARPYALLMLLALGSIYFLHRRSAVGIAAVAFLGSYTAATTAPLMLAVLTTALILIRTQRNASRPLMLSAASATAALILIFVLYSSHPQNRPSLGFIVNLDTVMSAARIFTSSAINAPFGAEAVALLLTLAVIGALVLLRRSPSDGVLLVAMTVLPIVFTMGSLAVLDHWYSPRYLLSALPAFLLLAGSGLAATSNAVATWFAVLVRRTADSWLIGASVAAALLLIVAIPNFRASISEPHQKPDWRGVAQNLAIRARSGEVVLADSAWAGASLDFYLRRFSQQIGIVIVDAARPLDHLETLLREGHTWLVSGGFVRDESARHSMCNFFLADYDPREQVRIHYARGLRDFLQTRATPEELARYSRAFRTERKGLITMARSDQSFLVRGWFGPETDETDPTQWCTRESEVFFPDYGSAREVSFRAWPVVVPGKSQSVEVFLNGQRIGAAQMAPDRATYRFPLPAASKSWNSLVFRFAHTARPSDYGSTTDSRELAAEFDWIQFGTGRDTGRRSMLLFRPARLSDHGSLSPIPPDWPPRKPLSLPSVTDQQLRSVVLRLGFDPSVELPRLRQGDLSLLSVATAAFQPFECTTDDQFIDSAYQVLLQRKPDLSGRAYFLERLRNGKSRETVLRMFLESAEFRHHLNLERD